MEMSNPHALICGDMLEWWGLYKRDYDLATPESNAHPAKASWDLAFRILDHLKELGWLTEGATVLDPMAGTGRFCLAACARGYRAIGCELEPRFVAFCEENRKYASKRLGRELDWQILQGDARRLSQILQERGLVSVTSPPYQDSLHSTDIDFIHNRLTTGPSGSTKLRGQQGAKSDGETYGSTPGQIGNLKDAPLKSITSPPYLSPTAGGGLNTLSPRSDADQAGRSPDSPSQQGAKDGYGDSEGQIGRLPDRPLRAITSPPYGDQMIEDGQRLAADSDIHWREWERGRRYNEANPNNIGNLDPETYLGSMTLVYAEIAKVADVLVVVTKNPTRNGKLRRLDLDTIALLEMTGWKVHCVHHAMLFEEQEQATLEGQPSKKVKGRMSFFKRLAWQKGALVAAWEDVVFCHRLERTSRA